MGKGRMLLISGTITMCFVITGTIALLLLSGKNPLESIIHKEKNMETSVVLADGPAEEPQSKIEKKDLPIGVKTVTDEIGVHEILFESGKVEYTAISGPIKLTVTHVRLERLMPATENIKNSVGGHDRATLVYLQLEVHNQAGAPVYFRIDDTKVQSDTGEKTIFHPGLSNQFGSVFASNEKKQGLVAVDFEAEPNEIAVIELEAASPYDQNYDALGETITLKVPMY